MLCMKVNFGNVVQCVFGTPCVEQYVILLDIQIAIL